MTSNFIAIVKYVVHVHYLEHLYSPLQPSSDCSNSIKD